MSNVLPDAESDTQRERRRAQSVAMASVVLALSGFVTYLWPAPAMWLQWTVLLHVLMGSYLLITIGPYLVAHLRRTLGMRKPSVVVSGAVLGLVLLALALSGAQMMLHGQVEALRWISQWHVYIAVGLPLAIACHIVAHVVDGRAQKRRRTTLFPTLEREVLRHTLFGTGVGVVLAALASALSAWLPNNYTNAPIAAPYAYPYGPHPFRPSQTETDGTRHFVDERQIAGSDDCAQCHPDIAQQWRASIHRQAASDRAYVSNVSLLEKKKGIATTRYCEGCHAPIALLTGQLSDGGKHGGIEGTPANQEGVSCMTCHGIREVVHLKGVASYRFTPRQDYLFETSTDPILRALRHFLIRIQPRQHRADMTPDVLAKPELCATCHAQFMDKDVNGWGWVKMQDDYSAWLKGPYSGQSDHIFANQTIQRCQDCHFPLLPGQDPSSNQDGLIRSHFSLGANTAIPWFNNDTSQITRTREFLQANRVNVSIDAPIRLDAKQDQKLVPRKLAENTETPGYFYLGETVNLRMTVANNQVGHDFPGGTADINEAWIEFRVTDSQNDVVFERGAIQRDGTVDPQAHFYRTIAVDRNGNDVWRHDLFNMIGERNRNVIRVGATDIVEYNFTVPSWVKGPLNVTAVLRYRKLNQRYAAWALDQTDVRLPVVDMARDSLTIPIRTRKPVDETAVQLK